MSVRDPKDVRNRGGRIVLPGEQRADEVAARKYRAEEALKSHPFYHMIENLRQDQVQLVTMVRGMKARFNALVDYLNDNGFLVTQPQDPETGLVSDTVDPATPPQSEMLFDHLIDHGILEKMPKYGLERYIEEYLQHDSVMHRIAISRQHGGGMDKVLDLVREFNNNPRRLRKVTGEQFGLHMYLYNNPDNLSDEELEAIANEFGLQKVDETEQLEELTTEEE